MAAELVQRVADVVRNHGMAGPKNPHVHAPCDDGPGLLDAGGAESVRCGGSRFYRSGGGVRFFVACSKANASSSSRGSLQAGPVKLTP